MAQYGILVYLAWGLNIEFLREKLHLVGTFFDILSPRLAEPVFDTTVGCLTSMCFACGAVNLLALKQGDAEKPGARIAREDLNTYGFIASAITYVMAYSKGLLVGSFGQFWTLFSIVMALGHYRLVSSDSGSTRKAIRDNLFKGPVDNLDALNSSMFIGYGTMFFLAVGLNLEFLHDFMASFMTMFGILSPTPPPFDYSMASVFGGACGIGLAGLALSAFAGAAEDSDYAAVRRNATMLFWAAFIVSQTAVPVHGSHFTFWNAVGVILVVLITKQMATAKAKTD